MKSGKVKTLNIEKIFSGKDNKDAFLEENTHKEMNSHIHLRRHKIQQNHKQRGSAASDKRFN